MRCKEFFVLKQKVCYGYRKFYTKIQGRYVLRSLLNMVLNVYDLNIYHQFSSEYLYLNQNYLFQIEILFRNRYGSIDSVVITRYAS